MLFLPTATKHNRPNHTHNTTTKTITTTPQQQGIVFSVRPPKKSWKHIANLSGGEKTLSSLALVFALHHYRPTPLYVMDEIDAALDFKNVSIGARERVVCVEALVWGWGRGGVCLCVLLRVQPRSPRACALGSTLNHPPPKTKPKPKTVGHYIKERTRDAQFVIISLRNNMFELADRLVGIYKTDNATKTVAINPGMSLEAVVVVCCLG
jgi:hypothetical protein